MIVAYHNKYRYHHHTAEYQRTEGEAAAVPPGILLYTIWREDSKILTGF